jgi:hypothetical protein
VVSFTRRLLHPQGKSPWYPLDRRLGGPQSRSGSGGEEKNSQTLFRAVIICRKTSCNGPTLADVQRSTVCKLILSPFWPQSVIRES